MSDAAGTTEQTLDPVQYRSFFAQLPTGVTAIVAEGEQGPVGMIVGTFSSVSLNPPIVSFMVTTGSNAWKAVRASGSFTANILAADQRRICETLAGWSFEKFRDIPFDADRPHVISGCLAWATCEITEEIEAGDHTIVLARPGRLQVERTAQPLIFSQRRYHRTLPVQDLRGPGWG